ncbi:hypothetical protein M885DRAFT_520234 [Pelagophyceae sp. CCMP2097]|nr:hypothetical protein M885DRAFT_520234 [Pelagophyceae sp. CCMP2097]
MVSANAIALDLAEAKKLFAAATRPAVRAALTAFITMRELDAMDQSEAAASSDAVVDKAAAAPAAQAPAAPAAQAEAAVAPPAAPPVKVASAPARVSPAAVAVPRRAWSALENYGWEQGEYDSPWVNVLVTLEGVGAAKDRVECDFTVDSFDLRVLDLEGKSYRLVVDAFDKDVLPEECRVVVKKNRITLKLKKVKGQYSYDHWNDLKKKGGRAAKDAEKSKDPGSGIMDMMKDLYDGGDDKMRKIIGESMMKSRSGEKQESPSMDNDFDRDYDADKPYDLDDEEEPPAMEGMPDFSKFKGLDNLPGMEKFGSDFSKLPGMENFGEGKKFGDFDD